MPTAPAATDPSLSDAAAEYGLCARRPAYFLRQWGRIEDRAGKGAIPFEWWPYLSDVLRDWMQLDRSILLKARQLGISWLGAGYSVWLALFKTSANVLVLSKTEEDAYEWIDRARFIADGLPASWGAGDRVTNNAGELEFRQSGGRIRAYAAAGGRGQTGTHVFLDEFAHQEGQRENLTAVMPTVADGTGKLAIISTAHGFGNTFESIWREAPANGWRKRFLPWHARPGRTAEWRRIQVAALPDPSLGEQEYPSSEHEAFVQSGRPVFHSDWLVRDETLRPCRPGDSLPELQRLEGLVLYRKADPKHAYLGGADSGFGLGADASCLVVLDSVTFEEVAHWCTALVAPDQFAEGIDAVARRYPGLYAVESNGIGQSVLKALRPLASVEGTPYWLYHRTKELQGPIEGYGAGRATEVGFWTDDRTKGTLVNGLATAVRERWLRLGTPELLSEMKAYQHLKGDRYGAPAGQHDDRVLACALAWHMFEWLPTQPAPTQLRTTTIEWFGAKAPERRMLR